MELVPHARMVGIALAILVSTAGAQTPPANWSAQGNQAAAQFGSSVASAGDVNGDGYGDVIIGARNMGGDGRAFVYLGSPNGLSAAPAWTVSGGQTGMNFGASVGSAGDVNGDGYGDIFVGANTYTNGQANEGALFLYFGSASGLPSTPSAILEGGKANGSFAFSAWGGFDVDGDGFDDVLVGAPGYNSNRGAAFLFCGSASGSIGPCWSFEPATTTAKTGGAVAAGDFNGDGYPDVVVGAQYYDGTGSSSDDRGAVYVFFGSPFGLAPVPDWSFVGLQPGGGLGNAVAGAGDLDGDGFDDLAVAAQRFDEAGLPDAGRVYLFRGGASGLASTWVIPGTQAGALFGSSVAGIGFFNDDPFADLAVGARYHDVSPSLTNAGAAFVYLGGTFGPSASSVILGDQAGAELGIAVGSALDVQHDGGSDLLASAWLYDDPESNEGVVYCYYGQVHAPKTFYVNVNAAGPGMGTLAQPYKSIQYALSHPQTKTGDTIQVADGVYHERIDFRGKDVVVKSATGPLFTVIDAESNGSAVSFSSGESSFAVLEGFTLVNGTGTMGPTGDLLGGGIYCVGSGATVRNCIVKDCSAYRGGGVYVAASPSMHLNGCTIRSNRADEYGGGLFIGSAADFQADACELSHNFAEIAGGGIAAFAAGAIRDSLVSFNWTDDFCSEGRGGGLFAALAFSVESCTIYGNSAVEFGGGAEGGTFQDCLIEANSAAIGGGISNAYAKGCILRDNRAFSCDQSFEGGGGAADSSLEMCLLVGNDGGARGGGAINCDLVECDLLFNGLSGPWDPGLPAAGGGAFGSFLQHCMVRGNDAGVGAAMGLPPTRGGGVASCTAESTSMFQNHADLGGGAANTNLDRCLVYSNDADFGGGGFDVAATRTTIWGNVAHMSGGGVTTPATLNSTILWGNAPNEVHQGQGVPSLTYCDVDDAALAVGTNFKADPLFWSLLGPDLHLRPGSPCIDTGDPSLPPDPDGSRADVGALPFDPAYCGPTVTYCVAKTNSKGCLPRIFSTGTPSIAASNLRVQADQVLNQKQGILFWGAAPVSLPFQGAKLCVQPPIVRTGVQNSGGSPSGSDCSGTFSYQWTTAYMSGALLSPGDAVYCQYWYRDPADPNTTGLTDALEFVVCF